MAGPAATGYAVREPDPAHRRRTRVRMSARAEELGTEIFEPVIRGTIKQAAAYPDAILAEIADFLSAHRAFLDRYLTAAAAIVDDGIDEVPDDPQPG